MNPERRNLALAAADAAARRLLVRTIDFRFNLEDAAAAFDGDHGPHLEDLWRLRADADLLCRAIDALAEALSSAVTGDPGDADEENKESVEVCGT